MKLTIDGKEYELKWGIGAHRMACEEESLTLPQLETLVSDISEKGFYGLAVLTYFAIKNYCKINDIEDFNKNKFWFIDFFGNLPTEKGVEIMADYFETKYPGIGKSIMLPTGVENSDSKPIKKKIASRSKKSTP